MCRTTQWLRICPPPFFRHDGLFYPTLTQRWGFQAHLWCHYTPDTFLGISGIYRQLSWASYKLGSSKVHKRPMYIIPSSTHTHTRLYNITPTCSKLKPFLLGTPIICISGFFLKQDLQIFISHSDLLSLIRILGNSLHTGSLHSWPNRT